MRLFRNVPGSTNRFFLMAVFSVALMILSIQGIAQSNKGVQKFGKALCRAGKTGYTAVLKDGTSFVSVKSKLSGLNSVRDKKAVNRYKAMVRACSDASAPAGGDLTIQIETSPAVVSIPYESKFPGPVTIQFRNVPSGVSFAGNDPASVQVILPDATTSAEVVYLLTRGKFTSPEYVLTLQRTSGAGSGGGGEGGGGSTPGVTPTPGTPPVAKAASYRVSEMKSVSITLEAEANGTDPLSYAIVAQPTLGVLSGSGANLTYTASHKRGSDSFTFTASRGGVTSDIATVSITVENGAATFAGDRTSLEPYRDDITEEEAVHLCNKISFGCPYSVIQYGVANGLSKFVDYLLTYQPVSDSDLATIAGTFGPGADAIWTTTELRRWWIPYLVRGNGVKERMSLFWHDHFAVDLGVVESTFGSRQNNRNIWLLQHLDLVRAQALSSFEVLYEGMHTDPAMVEWLDNNNNYYSTSSGTLYPNENYSREILELFSMGTVDFFTGLPNYDTDLDVKELTRAFTGINFQNGTTDSVSFFTNRWDPFDKTLFTTAPFQASVNYNYVSATDTILYSHPGTRRNIAGKLVRVLVMPNPSENVVNKLADQLVGDKFNISGVFRKIATSSMMFSSDARFGCVVSPSEQLLRLVRVLNVPITSQNTVDSILTYFGNSGQSILRPDTVFGWKGCGVGERNTQIARGENWLGAGWTLERQRQLASVLETIRVREYNSEAIATSSYLDVLLPGTGATPQQIVSRVALLLGIPLSQSENDYIVNEYMNKDRNSATGNRTSVTWANRTPTTQRQKLAGLVMILMQHPRAMTY
jgi:hypothetical protein